MTTVLVGEGGQLVDHLLALEHVVVVVDEVGDAVDDDQVGVFNLDGLLHELIAGNPITLVAGVDIGVPQTGDLDVAMPVLGCHGPDGLEDAGGVVLCLLGVDKPHLALLDQALAVGERVGAQEDGAQDVTEEGLAVFPLGTHGYQVALGQSGYVTDADEVLGFGIIGVAVDHKFFFDVGEFVHGIRLGKQFGLPAIRFLECVHGKNFLKNET